VIVIRAIGEGLVLAALIVVIYILGAML